MVLWENSPKKEGAYPKREIDTERLQKNTDRLTAKLTWLDLLLWLHTNLGCQTIPMLVFKPVLCFHMSSHCSRSNHNQHSHESFPAPTMNGWCVLAVWSFHQIQHRLYCTSTNIDNLPSFTGSTVKRLTSKAGYDEWLDSDGYSRLKTL